MIHAALHLLAFAVVAGAAEPAMKARPERAFDLRHAIVVAPRSLHEQAARLGPVVAEPHDVMDAAGLRWRGAFRGRPLILVGHIGNNRALLPLYAAFLDATDSYHPGGDGFVVRKLVLPQSVLVLGGSSDAGAARAIDHHLAHPDGATTIRLGPDAAARIPKSLRRTAPLNAWLYLLWGEERFAQRALAQLMEQCRGPAGYFTASDYRLEPIARGYRACAAHGLVQPQDALALDNAWLRTLAADQLKYWRRRDGSGIHGRHQTMGTSAFLFAVRMLQQDGSPNEGARALLARWDRECRAYFDNALATFHDDIEGTGTYHSVQPMLHRALETGQADYVQRQLPAAVARALAVTDSLGAYAGTGTYEEARPGTAKKGIMLGYPLAALAYLTRDPQWSWLANHFATSRGTWGYYSVWGAHEFRVDGLPERPADSRLGLQVVPLGPYRRKRHLPNAPASQRFFEKLSWRTGWERQNAYMALQGWQLPTVHTSSPADGNSIIRYTNRGRVWLFANCGRPGHFRRNAVFVSRGGETEPIPLKACELLQRREQQGVIMTATRLPDHNGADWTRHVWWVAGRYVVVTDKLEFTRPGDYVALCTWRSCQPAHLSNARWEARAGDAVFQLVSVDEKVDRHSQAGVLDGAAPAWLLRERRTGRAKAGDAVWFRNAFAVDEPLAARPLGADSVVIRGVGSARLVKGEMVWEPWDGGLAGMRFIEPPAAADRAGLTPASLGESAFARLGQAIQGVTVSAEPAPSSGDVAHLTDGLASAYAHAAWAGPEGPTLTIRLPRAERISAIELGLPMAAPRNTLPDRLPPAFEATVAGRSVRFEPELDLLPLHKGTVYPFARYAARCLDVQADTLRLTVPTLKLRRVWVRRSAPEPLKVVHFQAVQRGGRTELVVATAQGELVVLDDAGKPKWRRRFPGAIHAVHVDHQVLVATREAKLHCLSRDGEPLWSTSFLRVDDLPRDCPTPYSVARWSDRIAVGNYARVSFLDPTGRILNAGFASGAYQTGWFPDAGDYTADDAPDGLVFNVWARVSVVDGKGWQYATSLPCTRGALRLMARAGDPKAAAGRVVVVSENGISMLRARPAKTEWTKALAPIACAVRFAGGTAVAKQEGYLLLVADDGRIKERSALDGKPVAMAAASGRLYVASKDHVEVFDPDLRRLRKHLAGAIALARAGDKVWALDAKGSLRSY